MHKKFATILCTGLFALTLISPTNATAQNQDTPFEKAYDNYLLSTETYNKEHADYILAKSQHLKFQTLNSQEKAKKETLEMLQARDEVVIRYLEVLKERLNELDNLDSSAKQSLLIELDDEIEWFKTHKETINSIGTLEDLVKDSDEADARYTSIQPIFFAVLGTASSTKVTGYRKRFDELFSELRERVNGIKNETRSEYTFDSAKLNQIDRWIFETSNRLIRSDEKKLEANELILNMTTGSGSNATYNQVLSKLGESQQFILESVRLNKEITKEIKRN